MNIKINEYKLPMDKSGPYGITVGPDGAMWFTESRGNKIGRITSKEVCMERIRKRNGNHQNDIILTEQTASTYYDHFQPPTDEEGEVIVVEGY